jgi:hypothetical protein
LQQSATSLVTAEYARFDFVTLRDAGVYTCALPSMRDGEGSAVRLHVHEPNIRLGVDEVRIGRVTIQIKPVQIGSDYIALVWNDSLTTQSIQIHCYIIYRIVRTDLVPTLARMIHLPVQHKWQRCVLIFINISTPSTIGRRTKNGFSFALHK